MRTEAARCSGLRPRRAWVGAVIFAAVASVAVAGALAQWDDPMRARVPAAIDQGPDRLAADRSGMATTPGSTPSACCDARERLELPEPLDGVEWNPGRPLEVAFRVPVERGVSVGARAELEVPRAALDAFMDGGIGWNASATVDVDLDVPGRWRLTAGAGARSLPVEAAGAPGVGSGDAEGVVWLRIGTTF